MSVPFSVVEKDIRSISSRQSSPIHNLTFHVKSAVKMKTQKVCWAACLAYFVDRVPRYMLDDWRSADMANLGVVAHFDHSATLLCEVVT